VSYRLIVFDSNYRLDLARGATADPPKTDWPSIASHLANRKVQAFAGDLYLGEFTAGPGGQITTPVAVGNLQVGLLYQPLIQPLIQEVQLPDGISWGMPRRVCSTTASFLDTISAEINNDMLPFSNATEDPGVAPERFTGQFKSWHLGWSNDGPVIRQRYPLPFTLRSVSMEVEI
jgi:hypothetical protein